MEDMEISILDVIVLSSNFFGKLFLTEKVFVTGEVSSMEELSEKVSTFCQNFNFEPKKVDIRLGMFFLVKKNPTRIISITGTTLPFVKGVKITIQASQPKIPLN